jgi:hypothetical protein
MADKLWSLCFLPEFTLNQHGIMEKCLTHFLELDPASVLHMTGEYHLEKDLLSHTILSLQALHKTDRFIIEGTDRFQLLLAVLLHDVGKAVQWPTIDRLDGRWHFKGHDVVGARWFWNLVQKSGWVETYLRPVYHAIWYHMVRSIENTPLLSFLGDSIPVLECLHCADDSGRLEVQSSLNSKTFPSTLIVRSLPVKCVLPRYPIVLYIMGESGAGKTTLARDLMERQSGLNMSHVSHDMAVLRIMGGITEKWAESDRNIRGAGLTDTTAPYNIWYKEMTKDSMKQRMVRELFESQFYRSLDDNDVTICPTTVTRPSSHSLPFASPQTIKIVTAPERVMSKVFGSMRYAMDAIRTGAGWSAGGPLLFVPPEHIIPCLQHIVKNRSMTISPPRVTEPKKLISLVEYWVAATGSIDGMILAMDTNYNISVTKFECARGSYYNFFYNDGAAYDDPFHPGVQSPASYCRGTTLYYDDVKWSVVRLPMNRGREIAFNGFDDEAEDSSQTASYYEKLTKSFSKGYATAQMFTAKVDGSLLIVFRDRYGIKTNPLPNDLGLVFGTKGCILPNVGTANSILASLKYAGYTYEEFCVHCDEYMSTNNLDSICFEMVNEKMDTLVVDYPHHLRGVYFLGGAVGWQFSPFFLLPKMVVMSPEVKEMTIKEASQVTSFPLGPFCDHIEGSVVWVSDGSNYYPLKLKSNLYYILHTTNHTNHPRYVEYLKTLIEHYGWLGSTTYGSLNNKYLTLSLFAMVNLPENIIDMIPILQKSREVYKKMRAITGSVQDIKKVLSGEEFTKWCQFNATYGAHRYDRVYELTS